MEPSGRHILDECARSRPALGAYLDGELGPDRACAVSAHLAGCGACAAEVALARASRASLRRAARRRAPPALYLRIASALRRERGRASRGERAWIGSTARFTAALGAVAGASAMILSHAPAADRGGFRPMVAGVLDDLVSLHAHPLPPETTNPDLVPSWDAYVGVPIRPSALHGIDGRFDGARVFPVADQRVALLQYTVHGGHRITVYVFNPRALGIEPLPSAREVGERRVEVGTRRGFSIATASVGGVGYAMLSDLGADESAELLAVAAAP
jgi:anti-sigma factor RsiW